MAATLQIVGAVGSTTSLLDLNDNPAGILVSRGGAGAALALADVSGADQSMPVWSSVGSVPEATERTITVPVTLAGANSDALGAKVQSLAKLTTAPWVLRVRRSGATADSWIRCFPTIPQLGTDITGAHGGGFVRGQIVAKTEPYAYGARVDKAAAAVTQDPNVSTAFVYDVTGVTGDAPTPAFIRCSDAQIVGVAHGTLFAIRRSGSPTALTGLTVQAEAGTGVAVGTNVTVTDPFVDATLSAGNGVRMSFAAAYVPSSANVGRLTFTPGLTGAEAPGLYKIMARLRRSANTEYTITTTIAGTYKLDPVLFPLNGTWTRMVDLGLVQLPVGQPQQIAAPTGVLLGAAPPSIQIDVQKTSDLTTARDLDWDFITLVPADEDLGVVYQNAGASGVTLTVDGYAQDAYLTTGDPLVGTSTGYSGGAKLDVVGGIPRLYPGTNRLYIMSGLNAAGNAYLMTMNPQWSVSFWPRYTWLV